MELRPSNSAKDFADMISGGNFAVVETSSQPFATEPKSKKQKKSNFNWNDELDFAFVSAQLNIYSAQTEVNI